MGKPQKKAFQKEKGKYTKIFCFETTTFSRDPRLLIWDPRLFFVTRDFLLRTHDFLFRTHDFLPTTFYPRPTTFYPRLLASPNSAYPPTGQSKLRCPVTTVYQVVWWSVLLRKAEVESLACEVAYQTSISKQHNADFETQSSYKRVLWCLCCLIWQLHGPENKFSVPQIFQNFLWEAYAYTLKPHKKIFIAAKLLIKVIIYDYDSLLYTCIY